MKQQQQTTVAMETVSASLRPMRRWVCRGAVKWISCINVKEEAMMRSDLELRVAIGSIGKKEQDSLFSILHALLTCHQQGALVVVLLLLQSLRLWGSGSQIMPRFFGGTLQSVHLKCVPSTVGIDWKWKETPNVHYCLYVLSILLLIWTVHFDYTCVHPSISECFSFYWCCLWFKTEFLLTKHCLLASLPSNLDTQISLDNYIFIWRFSLIPSLYILYNKSKGFSEM